MVEEDSNDTCPTRTESKSNINPEMMDLVDAAPERGEDADIEEREGSGEDKEKETTNPSKSKKNKVTVVKVNGKRAIGLPRIKKRKS